MRTFELRRQTWLPRPLGEVFPFFADATNLETLTPPWLRFRILSPHPIGMGRGTLIHYRLRARGIPFRWRSEITAWEPPRRFVDEQRRGPYRLWVHEHRFTPWGQGTLVTDHVRYAVWGGALVRRLFVARELDRIFDFRQQRLGHLFAPRPDALAPAVEASPLPLRAGGAR